MSTFRKYEVSVQRVILFFEIIMWSLKNVFKSVKKKNSRIKFRKLGRDLRFYIILISVFLLTWIFSGFRVLHKTENYNQNECDSDANQHANEPNISFEHSANWNK